MLLHLLVLQGLQIPPQIKHGDCQFQNESIVSALSFDCNIIHYYLQNKMIKLGPQELY